MIKISQISRLIFINRILVRHGLDDIVFATHLFRPLRFVQKFFPWNWFRKEATPIGGRIRCALEDLGPIFVKFGQMLSTRPDLLPADIAKELALLQDQVPPFSGRLAKQIIEDAYGYPLEEVFDEFDENPLASASIAQVHTAKLKNGKSVIVKVVRPDIIKTIKRDIGLLFIIAELAERYWNEGKRLRPIEVVTEYEKTIIDELDLMREAANASQIRRNFLNSKLLYIPEIYWPHTRKNVMVMERISGIRVSDLVKLKQAGVDLVALSERGVEIFFTQVFRDNFFHADMHPGNIFVSLKGQYIAVDFGIIGTLTSDDQHYLAENFLAFFKRDYRRVAELHVESEWVPRGTSIEDFESAIRTVCEPIFEKPLKDISFGQVLLRLFQTARRFNMEVQPQLVLLQKTLLNIEGLGRELNPELDLWKTAKPYLENWMMTRVGPKAVFQSLKSKWPLWMEKFPEIPELLYDTLTLAKGSYASLEERESQGLLIKQELNAAVKHIYLLSSAVLLIILAIFVYLLSFSAVANISSVPIASWVLAIMGGILFYMGWKQILKK